MLRLPLPHPMPPLRLLPPLLRRRLQSPLLRSPRLPSKARRVSLLRLSWPDWFTMVDPPGGVIGVWFRRNQQQ